MWRFHAFFTTADPAIRDTVAADKTHGAHANTDCATASPQALNVRVVEFQAFAQ